ncbi:helix-turn-helix domain-containing protein [Streptomyces rubiginosohelvolus]|uniref:helix-turn-helix domain-containing protein n=1 Tax=Streptomyces rubiginosohelvolus TaxID=67362 RepID=UPI0035E0C54D
MGNRSIDPDSDCRQANELNSSLALMSLADVAHFLRKPKGWVYGNWRVQGIPFKKVGAALRCRPQDLDDWLDRQGS